MRQFILKLFNGVSKESFEEMEKHWQKIVVEKQKKIQEQAGIINYRRTKRN